MSLFMKIKLHSFCLKDDCWIKKCTDDKKILDNIYQTWTNNDMQTNSETSASDMSNVICTDLDWSSGQIQSRWVVVPKQCIFMTTLIQRHMLGPVIISLGPFWRL